MILVVRWIIWTGEARCCAWAEQVANIATYGSMRSAAWQPHDAVKVQLRDNEKGKQTREDLEKIRKPMEGLRALLEGCWSTA